MDQSSITTFLIIVILGMLMFIPVYWLIVKIRTNAQKKTLLKKVLDAVLLPINYSALFLENRKIDQLPFYYRWFLRFTRFTSRIHYFHFLPKALIALIAEGIITLVTGQDVLTALVFCWSLLFLIIISIVESRSGEMEEETVVFANKLFLYTVSLLTLSSIVIYFFFWGPVEPFFNTPFLQFMGEMAHKFNEYLIALFFLFWDSPLWFKLLVIAILLLYVSASVWVSKRFSKK